MSVKRSRQIVLRILLSVALLLLLCAADFPDFAKPGPPPGQIELARGWLYHGDRHRALSALRRARRVAPQQARYHPMVRDTVRAIAHAEPRPSEELRSFASWLGIES